jgi:hypothetical protein
MGSWCMTPCMDSKRCYCRIHRWAKAMRGDIERAGLDEVACIPLGTYGGFTVMRADLAHRVNGFALFWNPRRI